MEMTLRLLGVGPGDEVITSAYTYTASCSVICHVGATPVLVDVKKDSYEMDYEQLADKINEKTKALMELIATTIIIIGDIIPALTAASPNINPPRIDTELPTLLGILISLSLNISNAIIIIKISKKAGNGTIVCCSIKFKRRLVGIAVGLKEVTLI